ncbi:transmembrane and immunoglobulin domain-containing protein 1 [Odontesthes bonariensis]
MLMFRSALFLLLLCEAKQTLGINIQSTPDINSGGIIQVDAQKTVSLKCAVDGDIPADEELVWLRNGAVVQLNDDNKKGHSSVCVTPVLTEDNDAIFTCHRHTNDSDKASVTLNVTYAPALSESEEIKVELESALVLECDMRANPPISSMSWTLNGSTVDLLEGGFTVTNDGVTSRLQVNSVNKHLHEATYRCISVSPMYGERGNTFDVLVTERTLNFPLMPIIAGVVVVCATALLAIVSRWSNIRQCFK